MPTEIERKFFVKDDGWKAFSKSSSVLRQAYLASTEQAAIRVRIKDDKQAFITIKSARPGMSRDEFEYEIPIEDAHALLMLRSGYLIEKRRHIVPAGKLNWEIDVFSGELAGLVIAEIELPDAETAFEQPAWLGEEVTHDKRYYNATLAAAGLPRG